MYIDKAEIRKCARAVLNEMRAWHGTDSDFERFSMERAGEHSGSGRMAHGWGVYVSVDRDTAKAYALGERRRIVEVEIPTPGDGGDYIGWNEALQGRGLFREAALRARYCMEEAARMAVEDEDNGYYGMSTRDVLRDHGLLEPRLTGEGFYGGMSLLLGGDKECSEFLRENGFYGIVVEDDKYPGSDTYVVFDPGDVRVVRSEYI